MVHSNIQKDTIPTILKFQRYKTVRYCTVRYCHKQHPHHQSQPSVNEGGTSLSHMETDKVDVHDFES